MHLSHYLIIAVSFSISPRLLPSVISIYQATVTKCQKRSYIAVVAVILALSRYQAFTL